MGSARPRVAASILDQSKLSQCAVHSGPREGLNTKKKALEYRAEPCLNPLSKGLFKKPCRQSCAAKRSSCENGQPANAGPLRFKFQRGRRDAKPRAAAARSFS